VNSVVSYPLSVQLANDAFDRELLNSADSVAARVKVVDGKIAVDLPPAAQAILRYNNKDRFYYQVATEAGRNIAGDDIPLPAQESKPDQPFFRYDNLKGSPVRILALTVQGPSGISEPILVQVAETLSSRKQLVDQIIATVVLPQIALIALGVLAVWVGVANGLKPLSELRSAISSRNRSDLRAVDGSLAPLEVRPLVAAINELLDRLREDVESQRRFVANAAHQLRTPLAGLKTYVGLAQRLSDDDRLTVLLAQVNSGVDRMSNLANRLLSLAKAEPRSARPVLSSVELNEIASDATGQLVAEAIGKRIELALEPSADACYVQGDAESLRELVQNLVENAVRYTPSGGEVTVAVFTKEIPKITVEDSGPGIPKEQRNLVFERFYRGPDCNEPGSGLGLAIVKEIAANHGAVLTISERTDGSGTRVTVEFERN